MESKQKLIEELNNEIDASCAVCMGVYTDDEPLLCGHKIHVLCIIKSRKNECPLCRRSPVFKGWEAKMDLTPSVYTPSQEELDENNRAMEQLLGPNYNELPRQIVQQAARQVTTTAINRERRQRAINDSLHIINTLVPPGAPKKKYKVRNYTDSVGKINSVKKSLDFL